MRINVDENSCAGHGVCESIADDVFEVGDDGVVTLLQGAQDPARRADVRAAVDRCPTRALTLED